MEYKIDGVKIVNFKSIKDIEMTFSGESRRFIGSNGAGKSSLLDGMIMGAKGELVKSNGKKLLKKDYGTLIPDGQTSGNVDIRLTEIGTGKIVVIARKINKNGDKLLSVKYEDDSPVSPALMDNLISDFSINPYNFINLSPQEQAKMIGIDVSEFDNRIKEAKAERSEVNKEKLKLMKLIPPTEEEPEPCEKITPSDILEQVDAVDKHNQKVDEAKEYIKDKEDEVAKTNDRIGSNIEEINNLTKRIEELKATNLRLTEGNSKATENIHLLKMRQEKKGLDKYRDKGYLVQQLKDAEENNKKAEAYKRFIDNTKRLSESQALYSEISSRIGEIEAEKVAYLQSQSFPKEVSIGDDGGLLINGRELDETSFNHAKVMEIILALLKHDNASLKTIFIKDGNLYDAKTLERLESMGYQLLIEIVKSEIPEDKVIYIKESKIVDNLEENTVEQPSLFD